MNVREFAEADEEQVIALWQECGLIRSWNNPALDIQRKLKLRDSLFLVGQVEDRVIASVMGGYDGHRGWMNYLAVSPAYRRNGFAAMLITALEQKLLILGCPKLNLQIRTDNIEVQDFYKSIGFTEDAVVSMGKRLIPDE